MIDGFLTMSISIVHNNSTIAGDTELLSEVFNQVTSAIIVIDKKGFIVKANECACEMFGISLVNEKWLTVVREHFAPQADDGHEVSLNDGRKILVSTKPLSVGQLVVLTDLTTTRRLQERVGHMERLSGLGRMAASLAHQIRTPLSAAILYAANIANRTLNENARLTFCHKLMDRLSDLENQVRDILLFAKSGEQIVDHVDFSELVESIKISSDGILARNNAKLDVRMDNISMDVIANKTSFVSAVTNLVSNSLEAGAKHLFIDVSRDKNEAILKIADNGKGMPKEVMNQIFEPFYTTKSNGTGLGLAVVKSVVSAHQGKIGLVSELGKGTCFTIAIPLATKSEKDVDNIAA
jgi:two-component system, sensor histidine kinase FlrB